MLCMLDKVTFIQYFCMEGPMSVEIDLEEKEAMFKR